jgi:hypothetical protein
MTEHDDHSERAIRYRQYRTEAAERLGCEIEDERCEHIAVLRLVRDGIAATVVSGIGSPELQLRISENMLRIDEGLAKVLPAPKPLTVTLRIVDSDGKPMPPADRAALMARDLHVPHHNASVPPPSFDPVTDAKKAGAKAKS